MIRISNIKADVSYTDESIKKSAAKALNTDVNNIKAVDIFKRSVDARKKQSVHFIMTVDVLLHSDENKILSKCRSNNISKATAYKYTLPEARKLPSRPIVVGAGPAGLFCALILSKCGACPIVLERGRDVDGRKQDIDNFWRNRILNTESNVQYGEGGAGTFSDGKLNTGTKNERTRMILEEFVKAGAPKEILYNAKPHIGTDKLPEAVKNIRKQIISLGGEFLFETKLTDFTEKGGKITGAIINKIGKAEEIKTDCIILAIGHSARDTFELLKKKRILMEQKPFSVGVRIEHLRERIDKAQYGAFAGKGRLGAADYKLSAHLENGRGVYTFCMCPGGTVVAAASEDNTVVTNGMSEFLRNKVNSNSALLVGVSPKDFGSGDVLAGVYYQQRLERAAFLLGGEDYSAPVQRAEDFINNRKSRAFGEVLPSYLPGTSFANLHEGLPDYISSSLVNGLAVLNGRLSGFSHPDALLTGFETRSSSPVRIMRDDTMQSPALYGLYPCGEGAGYAGGIMSAAVDGVKCAEAVMKNCAKR